MKYFRIEVLSNIDRHAGSLFLFQRLAAVIITLIVLVACGPKVIVSTDAPYAPLEDWVDIKVLDISDTIPSFSQNLGTLKIWDRGYSVGCDKEDVLYLAKAETRKVGGNALKLTQYLEPDSESGCVRIEATMLNIKRVIRQRPQSIVKIPVHPVFTPPNTNFKSIQTIPGTIQETTPTRPSMTNDKSALLHIYRVNNIWNTNFCYDLFLGDSFLCRVGNDWKTTIKLTDDGYNYLWASTESKAQLPLKIEFGKEYYIRCGSSMGGWVARPSIELRDTEIGSNEFKTINFDF